MDDFAVFLGFRAIWAQFGLIWHLGKLRANFGANVGARGPEEALRPQRRPRGPRGGPEAQEEAQRPKRKPI